MGSNNKAWLCTLGLAYALSSLFLISVYEIYFRDVVVGVRSFSDNESFHVHGQPKQRRAAAAVSHVNDFEANNELLPGSKRFHTCTLHNKTIRLPQAPDLILAGAMKSGTSFFWHLLAKHPCFLPSKKFEAHFFDWNFAVPPKDIHGPSFWERFHATTEEEYLCSARKKYIKETFKYITPSETRMTYEKTPNYMFLPQVPEIISKVCPWKPKIILILRDPVTRAYSHFVMDSEKDKVNLSFEEYLQLELETLRQFGLTNVPEMSTTDWDSLNESMDHLFQVPPPHMSTEEEDHANWMVYRYRHMQNYLQRGIYSTQLKRWKKFFPLSESLMVIDNDRLLREPRVVMGEVLDFLGAPQKDFFANESIAMSFNFERKTKEEMKEQRSIGMQNLLSVGGYDPMNNSTRRFLEKFYRPYNAELASILGEQWRGVWDYKTP